MYLVVFHSYAEIIISTRLRSFAFSSRVTGMNASSRIRIRRCHVRGIVASVLILQIDGVKWWHPTSESK